MLLKLLCLTLLVAAVYANKYDVRDEDIRFLDNFAKLDDGEKTTEKSKEKAKGKEGMENYFAKSILKNIILDHEVTKVMLNGLHFKLFHLIKEFKEMKTYASKHYEEN